MLAKSMVEELEIASNPFTNCPETSTEGQNGNDEELRGQEMALVILKTEDQSFIGKVKKGKNPGPDVCQQIMERPGQEASLTPVATSEVLNQSLCPLEIDPEIRDCIRSLTAEEQQRHEAVCRQDPTSRIITVWKSRNTPVDGIQTLEDCKKCNLEPEIKYCEFSSKAEAIRFRIDRHKGRRNMNLLDLLDAECKFETQYLKDARANKRLGPGKNALGQMTQSFERKHTNKRIAESAGTSEKTVKRFRTVKNSGQKDTIDQMMSGDLSINKAYNAVMKQSPRRAGNPTLPFVNPQTGKWDNTIWNEDNHTVLPRLAEEAPHSVDFFIFDPPWNVGKDYGFGESADRFPHDQYINDKVQLFKLMAPCSKVGTKVACILEQTTAPKDERKSGADYIRPIDLDLIAGVRTLNCGWRLMERIIFIKPPGATSTAWGSYRSASCPILRPHWGMVIVWAYQEFTLPKPSGAEPDYTAGDFDEWTINPWFITRKGLKNTQQHPGTTPPEIIERLIKLYTFRGFSLVCDPFNGQGTTTRLCQALGRRYIGIEKNPDYCRLAQAQIRAA